MGMHDCILCCCFDGGRRGGGGGADIYFERERITHFVCFVSVLYFSWGGGWVSRIFYFIVQQLGGGGGIVEFIILWGGGGAFFFYSWLCGVPAKSKIYFVYVKGLRTAVHVLFICHQLLFMFSSFFINCSSCSLHLPSTAVHVLFICHQLQFLFSSFSINHSARSLHFPLSTVHVLFIFHHQCWGA